MNRRSLLFIVIGLISIILVSSLIAYELGFIKSSGPSANSSGALWQRPIENFANSLAADDGKVFTRACNNGKIFLTGNNALWIFNASTGDLVQSQQFDYYITPPIVLGNETFVVADLWLTAYD